MAPRPQPTHGGSIPTLTPLSPLEQIRLVRETMVREADAIQKAATIASSDAAEAAAWISRCEGSIVLTGVGKAGLIAQKLVATLASTGSPAHFLHPIEAVHGDLGRVQAKDLVIAFSNSGRSEEVLRVVEYLKSQACGIIAVTADRENPLADLADHVVPIGRHREACPDGLAPTCSTSVMLAVGDAIAILASRLCGFTPDDFARFHPGGALGRKLTDVRQAMRPISECRVAPQTITIREAMMIGGSGRRSGAILLLDDQQRLSGIFTDSDLARLLQRRQETSLDEPIENFMTESPVCVAETERLPRAVELLSQRKISELPVVDEDQRPIGMIDITDLVATGDVRQATNTDRTETPSTTSNPNDDGPRCIPITSGD
ncbi:KpsF/GutQ family sugar-phosphate isomerase [Rhodopirellula sp. JC737]|nr:KpsF/GutQ family sugar-phosphate isomerase [Rhodopirellula sp. JC737]MCC9654822.1 KpsF/GutQ family sugar-phosphate isomerase [Rhodopirellula sp. JC737]